MRSIDLDPNIEQTQRRLIDYYTSMDDTDSAIEMINELHQDGALLSPETGKTTLARALVVAAHAGDTGLALQLGERLGEARALAVAMIEAADRDAGLIPGLVETARAIGQAHSAIRIEALVQSLEELGADSEAARKLAKALG